MWTKKEPKNEVF